MTSEERKKAMDRIRDEMAKHPDEPLAEIGEYMTERLIAEEETGAEDVIDGDAQRRQELLKEFIVGEAAGIQAKIDQMAARQSQSIVDAISAMELTVADNLKDTMAKVEDLTSSVSHLDYEEDIDSMQGDIRDMREDVADLIDEVHVSKQMEIAIKGLIESVDKVKDLERSVAELKTIAQRNEDNLQGILGLMHSMAKAVKQLEEHKTEKE